jgi:predicted DCC family thiol-disulfide oxidoreductase YuxK
VIVFYDDDCGFCRWTLAWALVRDRRGVLTAEPIQSEAGERLLGDLSEEERVRSAHVVHDDGRRTSGGAAVRDVLAAVPAGRGLARVLGLSPRATEIAYRFVADQRTHISKLVPADAKRRADRIVADQRPSRAA